MPNILSNYYMQHILLFDHCSNQHREYYKDPTPNMEFRKSERASSSIPVPNINHLTRMDFDLLQQKNIYFFCMLANVHKSLNPII